MPRAKSLRPGAATSARRTWWRGGVAAAAVDEALLSALNFGFALVFIRAGSKPEYGAFAMVSGLILLVRGAQSSMVLTPLATMGGRLDGDERSAFVRAIAQLQSGFGLVAALLFAGGIWLFAAGGGWLLALGGGLALWGTWQREFRRGVALLDGRAGLAGDSVFACLAAGGVLALWGSGQVNAGAMLAVTGAAAGLAGAIGFGSLGSHPSSGHRAVVGVALEQARWSLPGTAVAWAQTSGYAYVVGVALGSAAVGQVAATRLFLVPLLLVGVAWGRMFIPRAAGLLAAGDEAALRARCRRALRRALAGSALYFALLAIAFLAGLERILPPEYAGCKAQVVAWSAYAVVNLVRSIPTNALVAWLEFRAILVMSVVSAAATLLSVVALVGPLGATGAIAGVVVGELVLAVLAWRALLAAGRACAPPRSPRKPGTPAIGRMFAAAESGGEP